MYLAKQVDAITYMYYKGDATCTGSPYRSIGVQLTVLIHPTNSEKTDAKNVLKFIIIIKENLS